MKTTKGLISEQQVTELANEYYGQLDKPALAKTKPQFCICPVGLVGSGKSTVLKEICKKLPCVVVSGDEIRAFLMAKHIPTEENTVRVSYHVNVRLKQEGYNIARDADLARPEVRALIRKANDGTVQEFWINVTAPEEVILNRLRARNTSAIFPSVDDALRVYQKRKEVHQTIPDLASIPFAYTFDTSRDDLDRQVDEFVHKARQMLA